MPQTVKKPKEKGVQIRIPNYLVYEIDELIADGCGYESRLEFIRDAIRRRIEYVRSVLEREERVKTHV